MVRGQVIVKWRGAWLVLAGVMTALLAASLVAGPARAGTWIQVSCVNPNGTAAPSEGWTTGATGSPGDGSGAVARCGPGTPMYGLLSNLTPDPVGTGEYLQYTPPAGSNLAGGSLSATLGADGYGPSADATAVLYEPQLVWPSDVFGECTRLQPCQNGVYQFAGTISLPTDAGGDLYVDAACGGAAGGTCNTSDDNNPWALVQVSSAQFLLSSSASPGGSGFTGTAMAHTLRGTPHLLFTATDPGGPGVYSVTVSLDGRTVWTGTPNTNGGECVPVGSTGTTLMFDYQQPCLTSENVEASVPTAGFPDGSHELTVAVTDAAGNSSTVFDQMITTSNPQTTPNPKGRGAMHARFTITWHWAGATTRLRSITVTHLPSASGVTATCTGRRCPRLGPRHVNAPEIKTLLHRLDGKRFHAGDILHLTVSASHRPPERIELTFRSGSEPLARLVKRP